PVFSFPPRRTAPLQSATHRPAVRELPLPVAVTGGWLMEPWLRGALIGAIVGAIAGGLAVVLMVLLAPKRKCPDCGETLPRFRQPANRRQSLWGGWTCPRCGCEVGRKGRRAEEGGEQDGPRALRD